MSELPDLFGRSFFLKLTRDAGETFNLYQVWDAVRRRIGWTVICASKDPLVSRRFAFDVELYVPGDERQLHGQRRACHGERDADVLQEGRCAAFELADVLRFVDAYRVSGWGLCFIYQHHLKSISFWSEWFGSMNPRLTCFVRTAVRNEGRQKWTWKRHGFLAGGGTLQKDLGPFMLEKIPVNGII